MIHDFDFDVHGNNRQQIQLAADAMADTYWGDVRWEITSISVEKQHVGAYSARVYTRAVETVETEIVETEINIDRDEYLDEVRQYYFAADDDGTLDALAHDNWPAVRSIAALIYDDVLPSLMKGKAK
jgi:hypothetical protein